jgi:hypothetical protein
MNGQILEQPQGGDGEGMLSMLETRTVDSRQR